MTVCNRCIFDDSVQGITFDESGMCSYCQLHDDMEKLYPLGIEGLHKLQKIIRKIKKAGKGKPYDVIVGLSGGSDSCYMLRIARQFDLRCLAVNFDNGWGSDLALDNMLKMCSQTNTPLYLHKVAPKEMQTIYKAFLWVGSPDLEAASDIGLAAALFRQAEKYGVKYIFEGHNFRTEGVSPLGDLYFDWKYVQSVVKEYLGRVVPFKTYPRMSLWDMTRWFVLKRIRKIRPLYYLNTPKDRIGKQLADTYGWAEYGQIHHENLMTRAYHTTFSPMRLGVDQRRTFLAGQVRAGYITKGKALEMLSEPPMFELEKLAELLNISTFELDGFMKTRMRRYTEFKTYKPVFEKLRIPIWVLAKLDLVPWSFYVKYTKKRGMR